MPRLETLTAERWWSWTRDTILLDPTGFTKTNSTAWDGTWNPPRTQPLWIAQGRWKPILLLTLALCSMQWRVKQIGSFQMKGSCPHTTRGELVFPCSYQHPVQMVCTQTKCSGKSLCMERWPVSPWSDMCTRPSSCTRRAKQMRRWQTTPTCTCTLALQANQVANRRSCTTQTPGPSLALSSRQSWRPRRSSRKVWWWSGDRLATRHCLPWCMTQLTNMVLALLSVSALALVLFVALLAQTQTSRNADPFFEQTSFAVTAFVSNNAIFDSSWQLLLFEILPLCHWNFVLRNDFFWHTSFVPCQIALFEGIRSSTFDLHLVFHTKFEVFISCQWEPPMLCSDW